MSIFSSSRSVLHHFKICFPLPLEKYFLLHAGFRTASKKYSILTTKIPLQFVYPLMATPNLRKAVNSFTNLS